MTNAAQLGNPFAANMENKNITALNVARDKLVALIKDANEGTVVHLAAGLVNVIAQIEAIKNKD